ncbi:hypothetical protein THRCLA_05928 [Thraustotheca clavata]|uniref:Rap-GAP domain-containing protein n=1 Tax=Thraustotheca clavata TaxID=74557 RepID=A0A1V9ZRC0_9STRA|nr:hypothetical protein THRCLA_05928 [Thraustotheca clavata]
MQPGHSTTSPPPVLALDVKKLSRFFSEDKTPRKRLGNALEFLKSAGPEQQELFWRDVVNGSTFFSVLHAYLTELETMYVVMDKSSVINKLRNRKFQTEDWTDVFEGLEVLIKSNKTLLASGWQHNRFLQIFQKLLLAENMPFIKKYAFRCLALYSDILMDTDIDIRNTAQLLDSQSTDTQVGYGFTHLDLLAESIDFSPYASGNANVFLPERTYTVGSVVGWERPGPTQAEEPVDMLKYVMDLSLERSDNIKEIDVQRFLFWCDVLMHSFMPLLYPKVCIEVGFKEKTDKLGFFHHCPGSFQRVMARWLYKLRSKQKFMDALWSRKDYVDVVMETLRQRFAYRDPELIVDGMKFYAQLCKGTQYMPQAMKENINELHRSMIGHVSQVFHPGAQFEDPNIFLIGIELMELLSQQKLHIHSFAVLRKAVLATTDASYCLRDNPPGQAVLVPMVTTVFHTWIHGLAQPNGSSVEVWFELSSMVKKWLVNPTTSPAFGLEIIRRWKLEIKNLSHLLQLYFQKDIEKEELGREFSSFLVNEVASSSDAAMIVVDRLLHVIAPSTIVSLRPQMHQAVQEAVLEIILFWSDKPSLAAPSTLIALFGEWFLLACEVTAPELEKSRCVALQTACTIFTQRAAASLIPTHAAMLSRLLLKALQDDGRTNVVSTVLNHASDLFTRSIPGVGVLIPVMLRTIDGMITNVVALHRNLMNGGDKSNRRMPRFGSEMKNNMISSMQILFALLPLPAQFPEMLHMSWESRMQWMPRELHGTIDPIPELDAELHDVAGRCFQRILEFTFPDVTEVQQRALWGLYVLIVVQLRTNPSPLVKQYVVLLCDTCASPDSPLALTALSAVHALHRYHRELLAYEPALVQHIIMALSLLVQQQVEDASNVVRDLLENQPSEPTSPLHIPTITHSSSDNAVNGVNGRKRSNSWSGSVRGNEKLVIEPKPAPVVVEDNPILKTIALKTAAVFEGLSDWIIECDMILNDTAVLKLLFDALEAALIGSIPQGDWQIQVEQKRKAQHKMDMPLLFLGLAMRASLDSERHKTSLQCFSDIAMAAEGFLMHLMHHLHGFPSPAGVDQLVSSCTEFPEESDSASSPFNSLSFVYMNSIVLTVVGSVETSTARIVARDMTGTFTWDAVIPDFCNRSMPSPTPTNDLGASVEEPWEKHLPKAVGSDRERIEVAMDHAMVLTNQPSSDMCPLCGGRVFQKPGQPAAEKPPQMTPFPVARRVIPKGNTLPSMPNYVFHEETLEEGSGNNGYHDIYICQCDPEVLKSKSDIVITKPQIPVCQLFSIDQDVDYIGGLDHERSMLDLLVDSIPMHYRDCGGDLIDKTLLGGRFTMQKYLDMEWRDMYDGQGGPLSLDSTEVTGFTFLQRLIHDEECYAYLKTFLAKEDKGKEIIDFCDAFKKYERSFDGSDRFSQASLIYWEFFSPESVQFVTFPYKVSSDIQHALQEAQGTSENTLPLTLFQGALDFVESQCFVAEGRLDRFIASINDACNKSAQQNEANSNSPFPFAVPPQLALYDSFSVMELNIRICAETLQMKKSNKLLQPKLPSASAALPLAFLQKARISPLDMCRLLLAQLGILPNENSVSHNHVHILENGVKLERSLKHLDKTPSRETMKIGVVYVGPEQSTQQEILGNSEGSVEYEQFLLEIGWPVNLATHKGFAGGLDHNPQTLSNGQSTLYYSNSTTEVIFHIVTKMPTKPNDPQQIDKKRHVGNDHVHIVWSDNPRAYSSTTITSNFNFVQIVIFPLRNSSEGLYLIDVLTKPNVPNFGPLIGGMIVTKSDLPELVRQTVMNANRACRQTSAWYLPPYPTRRKLIEEIVERYSSDYSEKSMLTSLFKIPSPADGHSI